VVEAEPTMGGEDFAFYTQAIPGAIIFLGHGDPATNYALHNPHFTLDERVLARGAALLAELALTFGKQGGLNSSASAAPRDEL
jgi:metal-dependent amidase/aminoacylase/carboxypeptidase family protein